MFVKPKFYAAVRKKGCRKLTHQIAGLNLLESHNVLIKPIVGLSTKHKFALGEKRIDYAYNT